MRPTRCAYQDENDYWRIRQFLRQVSLLNDRHDFAWSLLRWDYWVWHVNKNIFHFDLQEVVHLWEVNGQVVAMLNPDSDGEAFFQLHPAYREDMSMSEMLDIAEQKLAKIKAFCTVWFDDVNRTAVFEPVGTHPAHQKRGLGKAVMAEGLRRAWKLGATLATVSSYGSAAHALYESMGFTPVDLLEPWIRQWY
jgi:GNAT superfamily N-acetyltransferase